MKCKPYISRGLAFLKKIRPADIYRTLPALIYPENLYCLCCGDTIDPKTRIHSLCDKCIKEISWVSDNPYSSSMNDYSFDELFVCCIYGHRSKQMVETLKFRNGRYAAKPMAKLIAERVELSFCGSRENVCKNYDCISFIPMTKEKQQRKGYNHAQLLAKYTAKELGLPLADLLKKPSETPPVKLAGRNERKLILEGAFELRDPLPSPHLRVLLIDDVFTTGATANEAAAVLKRAGCSKVGIAAFASGSGQSHK